MSNPVSILSDEYISKEQFIDFLESIDAVVQPDEVFDGRISQGNQHIWIILSDSLQDVLNDLADNKGEQVLDIILRKLGNTPKSCIIIEISRTEGSDGLAIEFILSLSEKWHSIFYNLSEHVLSIEEIRYLYQIGDWNVIFD